MDELLRSRRLAQEILQRAQSIQQHLDSVNASIQNMQMIEEQSSKQAAKQKSHELQLTDLPDDCLLNILFHISNYSTVCSLAQTCRRWQALVSQDDKGWERRCRTDWGCSEPSADLVPRLQLLLPGLHKLQESQQVTPDDLDNGESDNFATDRCSVPARRQNSQDILLDSLMPEILSPGQLGRSMSENGVPLNPQRNGQMHSPRLHSLYGSAPQTSPRSKALSSTDFKPTLNDSPRSRSMITESGASCLLGNGTGVTTSQSTNQIPQPGSLWRLVYRDRLQGWQLAMHLLAWLRDHGSPASMSGFMHRLQLLLALRYMTLCTGKPQDAHRMHQIVGLGGIKSLLALLDNNDQRVVELALHILANLSHDIDQDTQLLLMVGSRMGKAFTDKLDTMSHMPGIMQQACRAYINCSVTDSPKVSLFSPECSPAEAVLKDGVFVLQEFSLRGESMTALELWLCFTRSHGTLYTFSTQQVAGHVDQLPVDCSYSGTVDTATGDWEFEQQLGPQHRVAYKGFSDTLGSYGTYILKHGSGGAWTRLTTLRKPRVYRLYRKESSTAAGLPSAEGL